MPTINPQPAKQSFLTGYILTALVALIFTGLGFGLYYQTIVRSTKNLAFSTAASPVRPGRILSFQGRLTDSAGNPITSSTGIVFKLFNNSIGGTELYNSNIGNSQTVVPDTNGIFSVVIGSSHGTEIPSTVFSENQNVYLEITAGGETMNPRQPIATVGYALNSETLQGLPPSASGLKNTVMVIDGSGNLNLGETSPSIISNSGTLGIEGQAMLLKTGSGSAGNITIAPDAGGQLNLSFGSTSPSNGGLINITNANFAAGNIINASINNDNRGYNFVSFNNYDVGTTQTASRFSVDSYGNTSVGGTLTLSGTAVGVGTSALFIDASTGAVSRRVLGSMAFDSGTYDNYQRWIANVGTSNTTISSGTTLSYAAGAGLSISLIGNTLTFTNTSTGTTYSFTNGLTNNSGIVGLGGTFTQNSQIGTSNFSLAFLGLGNSLGLAQSSSGNVGIGTSSPSQKLDINGSVSIGGSLAIGSTFLVTNLNADLLDGLNSSSFLYTAGTGISLSSGNVFSNIGVTSILGTANQITASNPTGAVTLSLPQNIDTAANVQFGSLYLSASGIGLSTASNVSVGGTLILAGTPVGTGTTILYINSNNEVTRGTFGPYESPLTFQNGLTRSTNTISIGGTLTQHTQIGTSSFGLSFLGLGNSIGLSQSSSGWVGIGNSSPNYQLDVTGDAGIGGNLNVGGTLTLAGTPVGTGTTILYLNASNQVTKGVFGPYDNYQRWVLSNSGTQANITTGVTLAIGSGGGINTSLVGTSLTVINTGVTNIFGTANQITASGSTGAITLSLPQNIDTAASVQFSSLSLSSIGTGLSTAGGLRVGTSLSTAGNLTIGGTLNLSNTNTVVSTGTTALLIDTSGNISKRMLGSMAFDSGTYDNYNNWGLRNNSGATTPVTSGLSVNFVNGVGISISQIGTSISFANIGVTSILGTANQITASNPTGAVTLSLPQNIDTAANVQFGSLALSSAGIGLSTAGAVRIGTSLTVGSNLSVGGSVTLSSLPVGVGTSIVYINSSGVLTQGFFNTGVGTTYAFQNGLNDPGTHIIGLGGTLTQHSQIGTSNFTLSFLGLGNTLGLSIGPSGFVGIGTSSPTQKLDVNGNVDIGGTLFLTATPVGTGTSALFIDASTGTVSRRVLGTMAFDSGTYDNYNNWGLRSNSGATTPVTSGLSVNFVNGVGISISQIGTSISFANIGVTSILGTANQITASNPTGAVTLSLPQNIDTAANVQFGSLALSSAGIGLSTAGAVRIGTSLTVVGNTLIGGTLSLTGTPVGTGSTVLYISSTGVITQGTLPSVTYTAGNGITIASGNVIRLGSTLTQNTSIGNSNFDLTYAGLGGSVSLVINHDGYVGVGLTSPFHDFSVTGTESNLTFARIGSSISDVASTLVSAVGSTFSSSDIGRIVLWANGTNRVITGINSTSPAFAYVNTAPGVGATQLTSIYTANFFIGSNGRIGVNTADPQTQFHVNGEIAASKFTGLYDYARYYLDPGNTTTTTGSLSLHGNGSIVYNSETNGSNQLTITATSSTRLKSFSNGFSIATNIGSTATGQTINWSDVLFINNNGKVGIGLTNPTYGLQVSGDVMINTRLGIGSTKAVYALNIGGTTGGSDLYLTGKMAIGSSFPGPYALNIGSSARIGDISVNGKISIGTTAQNVYSLNVGASGFITSFSTTKASIGTTALNGVYTLNVGGTMGGTDAYFAGKVAIGSTFPGPYRLNVGSSARIADLSVNGKVSIGSTAPGVYALSVGGSTSLTDTFLNGQLKVGVYTTTPTAVGAGSIVFATNTNTFRCYNGSVWSDCGGTLYSNTNATVADGSFLTVAHNQNTNDLLTTAWVNSQSTWKLLDGSYKPAIAWEGKDTQKGIYHNEINLYKPGNETNVGLDNLTSSGLLFDTFEDSTKLDSSTTTVTDDYQKGDNGSSNYMTLTNRQQSGRVGLMGGQILSSGTSDTDNHVFLGGGTINSTFYYDRNISDSKPNVQVELGIDPNWYNGVTLTVGASGSYLQQAFSQNSTIPQKNPNLTTSYNGSLIKVSGTYGVGTTNARTIYITMKGTTTFDWTDNNGNSQTGTTFVAGVGRTLTGTANGITLTFTNTTYNTGDVFKIASWVTEPSSSTRGSLTTFPEKSIIVTDGTTGSGSIEIIDADTQKLWMRFTSATNNLLPANTIPKTAKILNGKFYIGSDTWVHMANFATDVGTQYNSSATSTYNGTISQRNSASSLTNTNSRVMVISSSANDIDVAVIPNAPTQETTTSGWGYVAGNGTSNVSEAVNLPYTFNSIPNVVTQIAGWTNSAPSKLSDCSFNNATTAVNALPSGVDENSYTINMWAPSAVFANGWNYCYTWTATGTVSPKQFLAVATGNSTSGSTSIINETNGTVAHVMSNNGVAVSQIWQSKAAFAGNQLYLANNNVGTSASNIRMYYGVHGVTSEVAVANYSRGVYNIGTGITGYTNGFFYPTILGTSVGVTQVTTLTVTPGTSTADGISNTIYVGTNSGVSVIQEVQGKGNVVVNAATDGAEENSGSVKYYSKDYISESRYGNVRGMWPLSVGGTSLGLTDIGITAIPLTNNGVATTISGVRGIGVSLNGTTQYLSCTDAVCGGTTKLDPGSGSWTLGAWIKTSNASSTQDIMSKGTASGQYAYELYTVNGVPGMTLINTANTAYIKADATRSIADNQWHHIVGTYDGTTISIFVDGYYVGSSTTKTGTQVTDSTSDFQIGARTDVSRYFNGAIDEPFISATALTYNQIKNMFEVGSRALQSHSTTLAGGAANKNQQLGGATNTISDAKPDWNNQYLYVGSNDTTNGAVSKIDLNSDTTVKKYITAANVPAGGPAPTNNNTIGLGVGYNLELIASATTGARTYSADDYATATTGSFYSKTFTLPKAIGSAVIWASPYLDASDTGSTMTVRASVDGGGSYAVCTLVNTNTVTALPEREYACTFAASGSSLKVRFDFGRTSTRTNTYLTQYGITWLGQTGFRIEQADTNNIRLYNYTGESQNLKLDVTGAAFTNLANPWTDGGSYLYPTGFESLRIYDGSGTQYLGVSSSTIVASLGWSGSPNLNVNNSGNVSVGATTMGIGATLFHFSVADQGTTTFRFGVNSGNNNLYAFGAFQTAWSDRRLKHDITPQTDALAQLMQLNPVTYRWNPETGLDDEVHYGMIAQEVQQIFPTWVYTDQEGHLNLRRDELQFVLAQGVKEQQIQINQLKNSLPALDITELGQVNVNQNVSDQTLASLGYSATKNELETATYSISDSFNQPITRLGEFANLSVAKITSGLLSTTNLISKNIVADSTKSKTLQ
ncbi:tail fiber domain-containing protein, partial [Candidatus Shapirobacteria bacterium]|nr:tail fiber domain-containing protein [Candidatus Shapirobacteria bacterium]